ncbi:hypothetical protein GCM10020358_59760 [Amorphoplanes nipponensis]|uniref:Uncharacterized protein n=1 Tax=Actinoplanes nipponensis TaxID=135950 RepID=A0A919MEZ0_9ACTN|nr:hypothetical protein Ani05nite_04880 [Actinoplanes nipponensis]
MAVRLNENTNCLLRQYIPKSSDLSRHTAEDLTGVAAELIGRPRKILGWDVRALGCLRLCYEVVCAGIGIPTTPSQFPKNSSCTSSPEKQNLITFRGLEGHRECKGPMPGQDRPVWQCGYLSVLQHVGAGPRRKSQLAVLDPEAYRRPTHPPDDAQ